VVSTLFTSAFILFKPKDIVSGDFYWVSENNGFRFIAAADCTGHGVPGALMSMTGNNFLNQLVNERNLISTKAILTQLDASIRKSLKQERADVESKDGMDIALCRFNSDFSELLYSGANRPLWILRNGELLEFKANKNSIGGARTINENDYAEQLIPLQKKDCIYIFSDGFADQFGGPLGKKFMTKQLKQLISTFGDENSVAQKEKLDAAFLGWKQDVTQVDDVLVIGIKIA
jgi:serine phosphatase RsbU (regulator of sigma subunit)